MIQASSSILPGPQSKPVTGPAGGRSIGDAADIDDDAVPVGRVKQLTVECRNQWRALTGSRDIAAAEVTHNGNASQLRQQGAIDELYGIAGVRAVTHGLPMAADGRDLRGRQAGLREQGADGRGVGMGKLVGCGGSTMQFITTAIVQRQQGVAQLRLERLVVTVKQAGMTVAEIGYHGIYAVKAGT
jgi:hypothetical protein